MPAPNLRISYKYPCKEAHQTLHQWNVLKRNAKFHEKTKIAIFQKKTHSFFNFHFDICILQYGSADSSNG